ncbi:GNAT family N-acetyltransferase [Orbus wheelerorum]|uniref:GNAT family N-acetyltransferase n=1 Tax=Orbus wheelerorum TaxID=3074111 RepID=UPI00370D67B1
MSNSLTIIQATLEQLDDISLLFSEYREFYCIEDCRSDSKKFIRDRLINNDSIIFLAYSDKVLCGFVQLYFSFSSLALSSTIILNDLYVKKEYRTHKVATNLMQHVKNFANSSIYNGISLSTSIENHKAKALYEKQGYKIDDQFIHYFLKLK